MSKIDLYGVDDYQLIVNPGGNITLDTDNTGTVYVKGNMVVYGTTTSVESQDLDITDNVIVINKGETGAGVTLGVSGVLIDRGSEPKARILFDESKTWYDPVSDSTRTGSFSLTYENQDLASLYTRAILTDDNQDLYLVGSGTGIVTVKNTTDYEQQVFVYDSETGYIEFNDENPNNLADPKDDDALVNVRGMIDYVTAYNLYNWQNKIVAPVPEGNTRVEVFSTEEGYPSSYAKISIDGTTTTEFFEDKVSFKTDLETTKPNVNLFNTNSSTINAFGAGQVINIGAVGGITNLKTELAVTGDLEVLPGSRIKNTLFEQGRIQDSIIILKNTDLIGYIPPASTLEKAELFVNNTDGKVYFKRSKNAIDTVREIGIADRVNNVYYVSDESGNDENDGTTLSEPFKTIDRALEVVQLIRATQPPSEFDPITIYIKSGVYVIDNPLRLPARVSLVGDSLRTVTIRPLNRTQDMFWVYNGSYITQVTFKDHLAPSAAVAFANDGTGAGFITQSPYVQNCTSLTTTGTGMRVDGNHSDGLKSMVCDAFTQYNQGGIGIHMLNRGNTQLVSLFTICCDVAFLCEKGGFTSITNSNSTFGNYALKADGVSTPLYYGRVVSQPQTNQFVMDRLIKKPNIGDAVRFFGDTNYYTVREVGELNIKNELIVPQFFDEEPIEVREDREYLLSQIPFMRTEVIKHIEKEFPFFQYNEAKCSRDVGLIAEAVIDDMAFGTNYRSIIAGASYLRAGAINVRNNQSVETISALYKLKDLLLDLVDMNTTQAASIGQNMDLIINILSFGELAIPAIDFATPVGVDANRKKAADIIQANRQFLIEEGTAYIVENLPLIASYNAELCRRDVGIIVDAILYDMMFGSNFRSITAARSYYRNGAAVVTQSQKKATVGALDYLKYVMYGFVSGVSSAEASVLSNMNIIIDVLENGLPSVPASVTPNPTGYNANLQSVRNTIFTNRASLITQVIAYINTNYPSLSYNQATCERDLGYILEAMHYDLTYGGNLETTIAGNAYYSGNQLQISLPEKAPTVAALTYLKSLIAALTSGNPESSTAQGLLDNIIGIIDTETQPSQVNPSTAWVDTSLTTLNALVRADINDIQTAVIEHIEGTFEYDVGLCERDVGLIVDAVGYDMMFGSNFRSITAARSYYRNGAAVVTQNQKIQTLGSFGYLKSILIDTVTGNPTAVDSVTDNMNIILEILRDGVDNIPSYIIPDPTAYDSGYENARNLIDLNRAFIKAEIVEYINRGYPNLVYDQATCERDVDLIIDALYYDLTYGGNTETVIAANAYYSKSTLQVAAAEKMATVGAYKYMKTILSEIAVNLDVEELQGTVAQVTGLAGSLDASLTVQGLMDNLISVVETQSTVSTINPSTNWVGSGLVTLFATMQTNKDATKAAITEYISGNYLYNEDLCRRDMGYVIDAITYDMLYQGNVATNVAIRSYFNGGVQQIPNNEIAASIDTFNYVKDVAKLCVVNSPVTALNTVEIQDTSLPAATSTEANILEDLFDVVEELLDNRYNALITIEEEIREGVINPNIAVSFHQLSLITSSSHTFEWIGSGTDINIALPYLGGTPVEGNEIVEANGGRVYFTATDQRGDFKIGTQLKINRAKGIIEGRVFRKSLYSTLTPYILAIGE
jgi:hypothetical protein